MKDNTTLYVTVGLPGAGKTTRARQLEIEKQAIRLTPDEWMIPLFGAPGVGGPRDILEGRFIWLAVQAVQRGTNAILDFGVWDQGRAFGSEIRRISLRSQLSAHLLSNRPR
jgi:predicted kinase